ncbi:MAG: AAA family ATPase, partial [Candidatus Saccharimonadales bacterium]
MIAEIRLQQYRSYLDQSFKFKPGVNIVVGPNASGKTNLLEAVMVVCQGGSYRAPDSELIMHSKNWARIDALVDGHPRSVKLMAKPFPSKEFVIDNKGYKLLSSNNQLPVVLFEPNHLLMLSGSPELRRNYL